ncbi:hypothetical protein LOD99_8814 [Oopsacas minuta]|uniref:Uncharacterized protein n=1 Tax=Oopsacas minuta TaxID=111878 RepID=A0AAV7JEI6_9METZ|nr:hypothetical protein LOD99_8814 [Oopsacas minuta]
MFLGRETVSSAYFEKVNGGKRKRSSSALNFYTQSAFAALELTDKMIFPSSTPEKLLAKLVLDQAYTVWGTILYVIYAHENSGLNITNSIFLTYFLKSLKRNHGDQEKRTDF